MSKLPLIHQLYHSLCENFILFKKHPSHLYPEPPLPTVQHWVFLTKRRRIGFEDFLEAISDERITGSGLQGKLQGVKSSNHTNSPKFLFDESLKMEIMTFSHSIVTGFPFSGLS